MAQGYASSGIFFWNAMLASYIMSPNRRLSAMLRRYKALIGWPAEGGAGIIGVHIRRGDACATFRKDGMHHAELMPRAFCVEVERDVLPAVAAMARVSTTQPEVRTYTHGI